MATTTPPPPSLSLSPLPPPVSSFIFNPKPSTFSPPPVSSFIFNPKPSTFSNTPNTLWLPFTPAFLSSTKAIHFYHQSLQLSSKRYKLWRRNATSGQVLPSESTPLDTSQQIVSSSSSSGDTSSSVISILLFIAFVVLSILTIGVIYIGVTDFLQKREREKFEKEEAADKKKKGGKKTKVRARDGPRGFGQKIDEEDDDVV